MKGPFALRSVHVGSAVTRLFFAAAVATAVLSGCSHPITDFKFQSGTHPVRLLSDYSLPPGKQGLFIPLRAGRTSTPARETALYTLSRPESPAAPKSAFYVEYTASGGPIELHLHEQESSGSKTEVTAALPIRSGARSTGLVRFLVPIGDGNKLHSFRVTGSSPDDQLHIRGVGFTADTSGAAIEKGVLTIRRGIDLSGDGFTPTPPTTGPRTMTLRFPSLVAQLGAAQAQIIVTYSYHRAPGEVSLTAADSAGHRQRYVIQPRPGRHRLYLYTASTGFTPDELDLSATNAGFSLESVSIHRFSTPQTTTSYDGTTKPIPADIGAILNYQPKWWRQQEYELFSWSLIPSVLIMEFQSYEIQARFMKRFAFFVEKQGYAGKLWTNQQLAGLHGWNAHDYRPEDLARFYSTAAKENFTLDPEELQLRKILLANGVIKQEGNIFREGAGAILTFAHVGPMWLRSLLLTHEGYHGIFFTHPGYRKAVFSIWDSTPAGERDVFRYLFLPYFRYDINNLYLVKNEFQAYLMEQPLDQTRSYFHDQLTTEMRVMKIPADSPLALYAKEHPGIFYRSAQRVQAAVEEAVGVPAGDLVGLLRD